MVVVYDQCLMIKIHHFTAEVGGFLQIPISDVVVETLVIIEIVKFWLVKPFVHEKTLFVIGSVSAQ